MCIVYSDYCVVMGFTCTAYIESGKVILYITSFLVAYTPFAVYGVFVGNNDILYACFMKCYVS